MDRRLTKFILVISAAVIQNLSWLALGGIKINLTLITLLALGFTIQDWAEYSILGVLSAFILKTGDDFLDWTIIIYLIILISAFFLKKFLPWRTLVNYLIFVICATFAFYFFIDRSFIQSHTLLFLKELSYNLLFGGLLYLILAGVYEQNRVKL